MKKFLALVLALVMTMSLVTISAGAEFTDADSVTYEEAVDVMTAIGVVTGDTTGAFNPTNGLTRGAAAKIICNLILGPTTAGALNADTAPYADVAVDNVFAGYIAYCAQEGIISGYADGTFRPAAPLTGYAFMKMLLGALGYDATKEGYVGSNWSIAVAKQALALGLDDGLVGDFAGAKALTREEACLYALNALQATMVKYENDSTITVGDIVINNNSKAEPVKEAGVEVSFMETYFEKLNVTTDTDAFMAPANTWTWKNEAVGTYAVEPVATYTKEVTFGDLYAALGSNVVKKINTVEVFVDANRWGYSTNVASFNVANITKGSETALTTGAGAPTGNGVETAVYVTELANGTYDVDVVCVNTYVGKITKVTEATAKADRYVTIASKTGALSLTATTFETEDFAKGDYVLYQADKVAAGTFTIQNMQVAEKVGGVTVTAYKNTSAGSNFTADGVTYTYNKVNTLSGIALDAEVDAFVDTYGYVAFVEPYNGAVDLSNYLVITNDAVTTLGASVVASAVTLDGKELGEITLGKLNGTKIANASTVTEDKIYSFSVGEDGKYNLKSVASPFSDTVVSTPATASYSTGAASFDGTVANSATQFIVYNTTKGTVTVYDGIKNMVNVAAGSMAKGATLIKDSKAVAVYVEVTATTSNSSAAEDLVYILDTKFVATKDGDDVVYTYDAIVNGELGTISTKDVTAVSGDVAEVIATNGVGLYYIDNYDGAYVGDNGLVVAGTTAGTNAPTNMAANKVVAANDGSNDVTYGDDVLYIDATSDLTVVLAADCDLFSITNKGVMSEITTEDLAAETSGYTYWVVTLTENSVTEAVAVYVQK